MKKSIFLFLTIISTVGFAQEFQMANTTVNTCTGTFTDSGGAAANHADNESFTMTICPDVAGNFIELDFYII